MRSLFLSALWGRGLAFVLVAAMATAGGAARAAPTVVHLSPSGSDTADGQSEKTAFATLQGAIARSIVLLSGDVGEVEVWVGSGSYLGQRAAFEGLSSGKSLVIRAAPKSGGRPVFDGAGKGGAWLILLAKAGEVGNVQISGLEVTGYVTAITMNGARDAVSPQVVNVLVRNNVFRRIGQVAVPDGPPSAAAVRLVNAHNVRIVNNRFDDIKNLKRCTSLHAIYVAHNSTGNLIENNIFKDACGDPIRFRDGSGDNKVIGNTFINAWAKAPVTDWYCDSDAREDCTKATAECPSYGNVVEGNNIQGSGKKAPPMIMTYGGDHNSACQAKAARGLGAGQRFLVR